MDKKIVLNGTMSFRIVEQAWSGRGHNHSVVLHGKSGDTGQYVYQTDIIEHTTKLTATRVAKAGNKFLDELFGGNRQWVNHKDEQGRGA